ncbi:hypothetical protein PUNSTDRAFT_71288, partial [Punctularia strigosozonata HHB-11173 SS5]|uniref:uncharacterized protein n=1 Tax=Punctularia strigosozonata (strain HHB-11173) TaxID=741275 RepID=UPI0004416949
EVRERLGEALPQAQNKEWFPYGSKTMFLLDLLDSLPRIRISDALMRLILWVMRESEARDVPSLNQLRKTQESVAKQSAVSVHESKSSKGNIFYMLDPREIVSIVRLVNTKTRNCIRIYPEVPDGPITDFWHTGKMHTGYDLDMLTPMWAADGHSKHYYVKEFAQLHDGTYVVPVRWVIMKGQMSADAFKVNTPIEVCTHGYSFLMCHSQVELSDFLAESDQIQSFLRHMPNRPNPLRAIAKGQPMYSSFVDYWGDDVSGNRSKSFNKHNNAYITHRNLPRKLLQQEYHIHFVSTSQYASIPEQFMSFKKITHQLYHLRSTHMDPFCVHDARTQAPAKIRIFVNSDPADNPMQSEMSSHIGGGGNCKCRKCKAGGTKKSKEAPEVYHSLFEAGEPRTAPDTFQEVCAQLDMACEGVMQPIKERQTETGVKDAYAQYWIEQLISRFKQIRTSDLSRTRESVSNELKSWLHEHAHDIINPFLTMPGLDIHRDTPIELLHTVLLGLLKYIWHWSHPAWKDSQKKTFSLRLASTNTDALSIPAIRADYIMQYAGSLIGRQFKILGQTASFHVYDLSPTHAHYDLWKASGELNALLWFPEIDHLDEYVADVVTAAANVVDLITAIDPSKIVEKTKLHLLAAHLEEDIRRHGNLINAITESQESFNAIFRLSSVYSNHLAPSRDIAKSLSHIEGMKRRLNGGFWCVEQGTGDESWTQAGAGVRNYMNIRPSIQRHLGWCETEPAIAGSVRHVPIVRQGNKRTARPIIKLADTKAVNAVNADAYDQTSLWTPCSHVVAQSQDVCMPGSWVFTQSPLNNEVIIGRIVEILDSTTTSDAVVLLDQFHLGSERHRIFSMPTLARRLGEVTILIIPTKSIRFAQNVQHDCVAGRCSATGQRKRKQERKESDIIEHFVQHNEAEQSYIINAHAFHNAHLLRRCLPRALWEPILHYEDRTSHHYAAARRYQHSQSSKRAKADAQKNAA